MYAIAIDEKNIYFKCPFDIGNELHIVENTSQSLLNNEIERNLSFCDKCGDKVCINITDDTERITLQKNKRRTSFSKVKKSRKRLNLLYNLEVAGRRTINKTPPLQSPSHFQ